MQTKTYPPEFRAEAVKLVLAQGLSLEEAAQHIAMPKGTLANWVSSTKRGNAGTVMPGSRTVPELEALLRHASALFWHSLYIAEAEL